MKTLHTLFFLLICQLSFGQVPNLYPTSEVLLDFSPQAIAAFNQARAACNQVYKKMEAQNLQWDQLSAYDKKILEKCEDGKETIWETLGLTCGWYCGMVPKKIEASSTLAPQGKYSYDAKHIHDFSYKTAWVEGVSGYGIGEYLLYTFAPENPRINEIKIVNGFVMSQWAWESNSRVKKINMYVNGKLFAYLHLKDNPSQQHFSIPTIGNANRADMEQLKKQADWTIKFEIAEVYQGSKYADVAITEIFFDGLDVLCLVAGTKITMADGSLKNIEDLQVGESVLSYNTVSKNLEAARIEQLAGAIHKDLIKIDLSDGSSLTCTQDHPLYDGEHWYSFYPEKTIKYYEFNQVKKLGVGTELLSIDNKHSITSIELIPEAQQTYTIVALDQHKTFVANGIIVGTEPLRTLKDEKDQLSE